MSDHSVVGRRTALLLPILISVLIALFLMALMPTTMFWDRDEGFYARAAIEMMQTGHWILPTYNDAVFPEKPPLIYWLMALSMKVFGPTAFGARFISAPATAVSAFLVFLIGNRLFSRKAGLWATAAFASSTLVIYLGITAMMDAVLIAFICLALWVFLTVIQSPRYFWVKTVVFGVAVALSMLTKGPVGPAMIIPTVAFTWLFMASGERPSFGRMVALALAAIAGFGVFLLWAIPANNMSNGEMLSSGVGVHIIGRALHPMEGHGGKGLWGYLATVPAYIPVILIGFMPATIFLFSALSGLFRKTGMEKLPRLFLLSWALPGFFLFSLAATKLPHYIVPIFPALALAVGAVIDGKVRFGSASAKTGRVLYLVLTLSLAAALLAAAFFAPGLALDLELAVLALVVAGFGFWVFKAHREGNPGSAMRRALGSVFVLMLALFYVVIPPFEPMIKISKPIAETIRQNFKPGTPVFEAGYLEPSLVFYLDWPANSPIRPLAKSAFGSLFSDGREKILIAVQKNFDAIEAMDTSGRITKLGSYSAWNTNSSERYQTVIVARIVAAQ